MSLTFREGGATAERLTLWRKIFRFNWGLAVLITAAASVGFLMLISVAGGELEPWAGRQMVRFGAGLAVMGIVAMVDLRFWRLSAPALYGGALALLIGVELLGVTGMGAQRWIDLGFFRLQPSELMKITLIVALAAYYSWLDPEDTSRLIWLAPPLIMIAVPVLLVLKQPDLGTAILLVAGGLGVMFLAGVTWWFFIAGFFGAIGMVTAVLMSRGTDWQILKDYQFRRIEVFLDPSQDPLGSGYHITQSKIDRKSVV